MPGHENDPTFEDSFTLVKNEIQAEIIRVLGDALEGESDHVLSFSEIRARTSVDISPSQLTYHLRQLRGQFVTKSDDGYELRPEGQRFYRLLRMGTFHRRQEHIALDVNFDCYYCETPVEALFIRGQIKVECPKCEYRYLTGLVEPQIERLGDEDEAFAQFSQYVHHKILGFARGVCPTCGNAVETVLRDPDEMWEGSRRRRKVVVDRSCDCCGTPSYLTVGMAMLADTGLISFCHDHGVDVLRTPYWDLEFAATDAHVTVRSTNPWEVALRVTYSDETLQLVVDGDLRVIERSRL